MSNPPALRSIGNDSPPIQNERPAFWRLPGEPQLWFNRFKRYYKLGPKRSLLAALRKEREQIKAVKSVEIPASAEGDALSSTEDGTPRKAGTRLKTVKTLRVPGSWSQACQKWRWVERARIYDQYIIDKSVDDYISRIYDRLACKEHRLWEMSNVCDDLLTAFRRTSDVNEKCLLAARIQSIMHAVKEEMADYDEQVSRQVLERGVKRRMKEQAGEKLEDTTVAMLTEYGFAADFGTEKMGWMN